MLDFPVVVAAGADILPIVTLAAAQAFVFRLLAEDGWQMLFVGWSSRIGMA
ncbi:hypothetical protein D3C80_1948000 [compost metagenome]